MNSNNQDNQKNQEEAPPEVPYKDTPKKERDNDFTKEKEKNNDPMKNERGEGGKEQKEAPEHIEVKGFAGENRENVKR